MASKSLGTLTLDLIAKVGSFTGPLDRASQVAKKRNAEIAASFNNLAKGIGTAIGSIPAVVAGVVVASSAAAKEIGNLAALAGLSTTEFQKLAAGSRSVGVDQEKLADIFKDTNDKLGDFINTGGGALKDFFTNIAPMVGVTADQFKKLNSKDALALYVTSLEKANVSQAEMTFYMEAIASDSTSLVPLLRESAKGFDELGASADAAGVIMSDSTIAAAKQFGFELDGLLQYVKSVQISLAAEFSPLLLQMSKDLKQAAIDAGGVGPAIKKSAAEGVEAIAFIVDAGDGVGRVFKIISAEFDGLVASAAGSIIAGVYQTLNLLNKLPGVDLSSHLGDLEKNYNSQVDSATDATNRMRVALETPLAGTTFLDYYKRANEAAKDLVQTNAAITKGTGSGVDPAAIAAAAAASKKAASDAASAAKKIQDSFSSTETDLKRQIDLINTSTDAREDATEAAKIQFEFESGKLVGLNAQQKERLQGLAEELDKRKKLKQANEDDKTVREFQGSVDHQLKIDQRALNTPFLNAYDTDEVKQRSLDMLGIEQDYQDKLEELRQRHEEKAITDSVFERETAALEKALQARLGKQEKYYQNLDVLQRNGTAGLISGFATQAQASMDLYSTMRSVGADTFHNLTDAITEWAETGKLDAKGLAASFIQSVGHALLSYAAAQVAMAGLSAFSAMIGVPFVGPFIAPGAAIAATAAAGVMMTAVGSALDGQAHDGIDYVPADGTWNLKKGERVTTAETSAKLDRTLDRVSKDRPEAGPSNQVINLIEDASRAGQVNRRQLSREDVTDIYISDIRGEGPIHEANQSKYGLKSQGY